MESGGEPWGPTGPIPCEGQDFVHSIINALLFPWSRAGHIHSLLSAIQLRTEQVLIAPPLFARYFMHGSGDIFVKSRVKWPIKRL